jgi:glycosyltransferase involved in cell wall biosynthesis
VKVAFIHDWLTGMRGGEKVLEAACELFPGAEIYTLIHRPERVSAALNSRRLHVSGLNSIPGSYAFYRYLLPLMPMAVESFDLSAFDLVVSFSHCVAKGVNLAPRQGRRRPLHLCYCHTPMRYVYDQFDNYFAGGAGIGVKQGAALMRPYLIRWDQKTSKGVDSFMANSENVSGRIRAAYGRESEVIYPGVETEFYRPAKTPRAKTEPYYLIAGALVPYKRVDLAIAACRELGVPLKVAGVGTERPRLEKLAEGAVVEFTGWQSDEDLRELYRGCEAFLFPADEDFGIAPVEAMACGRPVVAFKKGGALETVKEGITGVFFEEQTAASLAGAMKRARGIAFDPAAIRDHAVRFDTKIFKKRFGDFVRQAWEEYSRSSAATDLSTETSRRR